MHCAPNSCTNIRTHRSFALRGVLAIAALVAFAAAANAQNTFAAQAVGSTSAEQAVVVSSPSGGSVKTVEVLTAGAPSGDFAAGAGASTCPGDTLTAPGSCTEYVTFKPSAPGLRVGAVVLLDASNNVLGTAYISGTGSGGLGVIVPGNLTVAAGVPNLYTSVNDGQPATSAELQLPSSVVLDGAGNMYIADSLHNRIRMVCGAATTATIAGTTCTTAGIISTIVGDGKSDYTGDGGLAANATVNTPNGVTVDGAGNLYIADTANNVIREINAATGNISTIAGGAATVCGGSTDSVGDGCLATQAQLDQPWGVTVDASGNLYIADTYGHRIREVYAATGVIATIAGTGNTKSNGSGDYNGDNIVATTADLNFPHAVAFDAQGNMYIPDAGNQRVREVLAVGGVITAASKIVTFAGDGTQGTTPSCTAASTLASQVELSWPEGVAIDPAGNVYIADSQNAGIRKVNPSTLMVSSVAQGNCGQEYVDGNFEPANLYGPMGLYIDGQGNLYLADYYNMVIREIQSNYLAINDLATPVRQGSTSTTTDVTVENDGNASLDLTALTAGANTAIDGTVPNSCVPGLLAVYADCTVGAQFAPAATPTLTGNQNENGTITTDEDTQASIPAPNNPLAIQLFGVAEPVNGTNTTVSSNPDPSTYGSNVTFTVTVTTGSGTGNLTGTVSLIDTYNGNTTTLAPTLPLTLNGAGTTGTATFVISTLGVGQHSIVADYSGDTGHFKSASTDAGGNGAPYIQTVNGGTSTALNSSLNPSTVGASVTFTAIVSTSVSGVTPDGTITFMDGANTLGSPVTLSTIGGMQEAQYTTSTLTNGVHQITAVYSGDAAKNIQGDTSNTLSQDVQAAATLAVVSNLNPSYFGNNVTFTATVTSTATQPATGTIVFLDNGTQIGTGTLSGNPAVATFATSALAVGTHPITATYAGDNYNAQAATASALSQVVNLAQSATTVTAAPSPGIAGTNETITATVTLTQGSGTPTGTVTFTSGTTTLGTAPVAANGTAALVTQLAPGNYQIIATYGGVTSQINGSASNALPLAINQATTATALTITPAAALVTQQVTFTAKVTGNGETPGGTVNFIANGSTIGGGTLNSSGVATFSTSSLAVGTYSVTAQYVGDTNDAASTSAAGSLTVSLATTAVALTASPSPALIGQTITFTAKVTGNGGTPTGTVNFIANGNAIGAGTLTAGTATFTTSSLAVGTYTVTATYLGDADDAGSTSASLSETIGLIPTETDLGSASTTGSSPQVILVASVLNGATGPMPTGTITFNNGTTAIGAAQLDSSGVATISPSLQSGVNYNITAVYSGDASHSASTSQAVSISGTAQDFNFSVTPPALTIKTTQNATVQINLSSNGGFTDTIGLGCASLPPGINCHFAPNNVTLPANGVVSAQLTIDTNNPLSGGGSAMNRPAGAGSMALAGIFLPIGAFFGWLLFRQRRRSMGLLTLVLVLGLSVAALFASGCSGIGGNAAVPGTYTIQVTGTGANSNVTHYQNVTLTITQ